MIVPGIWPTIVLGHLVDGLLIDLDSPSRSLWQGRVALLINRPRNVGDLLGIIARAALVDQEERDRGDGVLE